MTGLTVEQIEKEKELIDSLTQEQMAYLWRYAPVGHPYFQRGNPLSEYFDCKFKGFTPEISKAVDNYK